MAVLWIEGEDEMPTKKTPRADYGRTRPAYFLRTHKCERCDRIYSHTCPRSNHPYVCEECAKKPDPREAIDYLRETPMESTVDVLRRQSSTNRKGIVYGSKAGSIGNKRRHSSPKRIENWEKVAKRNLTQGEPTDLTDWLKNVERKK